jgi:hypothetical protein
LRFRDVLNLANRIIGGFILILCIVIGWAVAEQIKTHGVTRMSGMGMGAVVLLGIAGLGFLLGIIGRIKGPIPDRAGSAIDVGRSVKWLVRGVYGILLASVVLNWSGWMWLILVVVAAIGFEIWLAKMSWRRPGLPDR